MKFHAEKELEQYCFENGLHRDQSVDFDASEDWVEVETINPENRHKKVIMLTIEEDKNYLRALAELIVDHAGDFKENLASRLDKIAARAYAYQNDNKDKFLKEVKNWNNLVNEYNLMVDYGNKYGAFEKIKKVSGWKDFENWKDFDKQIDIVYNNSNSIY